MKNILLYIYYRIAKFYYKWDGEQANTAIVAVSLIQNMCVGALIIFITRIYLPRNETYSYAKTVGYVGAFLFIGTVLINYKKYKDVYPLLEKRWQNENVTQSLFRGLAVFLSMLIPLIAITLAAIKP